MSILCALSTLGKIGVLFIVGGSGVSSCDSGDSVLGLCRVSLCVARFWVILSSWLLILRCQFSSFSVAIFVSGLGFRVWGKGLGFRV
jgi:hypothetical protein